MYECGYARALPRVKTHINERELIFPRGEAGLPPGTPFVRFRADVGSTEARERAPTCTKAGFHFHGGTALRGNSFRKAWGCRFAKRSPVLIFMEVKELFRHIEENRGRFLDFLEDICNIEATARDTVEMNRLAAFIADFARKEGLDVRKIPFERAGDMLAIELNPGAEKGAFFIAHMDTVHKPGVFGTPAVKRCGEKLIGPGVIDCKGGIAVALLCMAALRGSGYDRCARLLLTSDEEISDSLGGERELELIRESAKGFPFALNCEVGRPGEAVVSRKGIYRCRIDIKGVSSHAGIDYFAGRSAVREAAEKIIALESQSRQGGTTYNCTCISGGSVPNIVPDECSFIIDARVNTDEAMREAVDFITSVAEKSFVGGTSGSVTKISSRAPMLRTPEVDRLFAAVNAVSQKYGLGALTPVESGGGSDSAYTQQAGVPTLDALGTAGDHCHTTREFAYISSLGDRAKLLAAFICEARR